MPRLEDDSFDDSFDELVKEYQDRISGYLYRLVGDYSDVQDLTQETFFRAYRARHQLRSQESVITWLFSIATNLARDYNRRKPQFMVIPLDVELHDREDTDSPDELPEESDVVGPILAQLPVDAVRCLLLHEVEGFTSVEIAGILGIKADAARQRIARARRLFKQAYANLTMKEQH